MKVLKKLLAINLIALTLMTVPMIFTDLSITPVVQAASSIKISKKKKTLRVGDKYTLKITGTSKKVKWKSSNKKVATVNSKGKVKAKKKGTATITAKVGGKKYKCKITVKKAKVLKVGKYTLKFGKYIGDDFAEGTDRGPSGKAIYTINKDGTYSFAPTNGEVLRGKYKVVDLSSLGSYYKGMYGLEFSNGGKIGVPTNDTLEVLAGAGNQFKYQGN